MLTRFVFTATRLPLSSTVRCLQSSAKTTTSRFGGYAERASKFAEKMKEAGMRTWGPTIKERLLGPTTGKPFIYGSLALAAASGLGMGALMCYSLNKSDASIMQQSAAWSKSVRQNLANTYSYLFASFVITTAMAFLATRSPTLRHFSMKTGLTPFLTSFFLANGTLFVCLDISYDKTLAKHAAWLVNCGVMGAMILAPLCVFGGPVLMRAAWYTAGIVAGLSATAITAPSEKFLKWSAPLGMALGVVFMANVGCFWLPTTTALGANLASITVYGGLILFSMFLLQDTQLIIQYAVEYDKWVNQNRHMMEKMPSFDPINASIRIFVDVLNIYIRMTTITSDFKAIGTK